MKDSNLRRKRNRDNNVNIKIEKNIENINENMNLFIINNPQILNSDEIENLKKELSVLKDEN